MPELPEVEVVRLGLAPVVSGAEVDSVEVRDPRSLKRHRGPAEDFIHALEHTTFETPLRRGKFLWVPLLGQDVALVCHLGMSGQVLLGDESSDFGPHLRIRLRMRARTGGQVVVGFVDQRVFGSMAIDDLISTNDGYPAGRGGTDSRIPRSVAHIARDPLDPAFDEVGFSRKLRAKKTDIKRALLDQSLISGIGNIYADEALWASQLHYRYPTFRMTKTRVAGLLENVTHVLGKALEEGGTSFDQQYVNVNGESGYFSHSLNAYGQEGKPCPRCATILRREPFMNRSSHRCPRCQRTPRSG
jgi:formamidopyrimidine-DNA glycosylase